MRFSDEIIKNSNLKYEVLKVFWGWVLEVCGSMLYVILNICVVIEYEFNLFILLWKYWFLLVSWVLI